METLQNFYQQISKVEQDTSVTVIKNLQMFYNYSGTCTRFLTIALISILFNHIQFYN